jgi:outer membrane receptor protein involved in Fe transport
MTASDGRTTNASGVPNGRLGVQSSISCLTSRLAPALRVAALALITLSRAGISFGDTSAPDDLAQMSLADLAKIGVTSVSKTSEVLQRAPAAIYVISHDDIARSGVTSVPEALRLAPNLLVTQTSSSAYVISARGFSGNPTSQNFSNKLLILIDGRSVYTPLYSGIYANTLDVMLEDIDRIEVISGVGATLWGANAMNGVINIITRASYLTQGSFINAAGGDQVQLGGARYGGRINADSTFQSTALAFTAGRWSSPMDQALMMAGQGSGGFSGRLDDRARFGHGAGRFLSGHRERFGQLRWLAARRKPRHPISASRRQRRHPSSSLLRPDATIRARGGHRLCGAYLRF